MKRLGVALLALSYLACSGGPADESEGMKLNGVAAVGAPISGATLRFKDARGATATAVTAADGSYALDTSALAFPVLLQVDSPEGTLFSAAFASGVTNVHPFTNLVVRNWYKVQGIDVDAAFATTQPLSVPTSAEIDTIKAVVVELVGLLLEEAGLPAQSFDLFSTPFRADGSGFDRVLDRTDVSVDPATSSVRIATSDPTTGLRTETTLDLSRSLGRDDTTAPSVPAGVAAVVSGTDAIVLTWTPSTDDVAVAGYRIYRGGAHHADAPYPVYKDAGLQPGTEYCYLLEAFDAKGNVTAKSAPVCATTLRAADTTPPSAPTQVQATAAGSDTIELAWAASTDANGVLGYRVLRAGAQVSSLSGTRFTERGLAPGTRYCYTVVAFDGAGNGSTASAESCATTATASEERARASGTYTYVSDTLTVSTTASNGCHGPQAGDVDTYVVSAFSATSMTWDSPEGEADPMVWTRPSGVEGSLVGTWSWTTPQSFTYTLTVDADGTWSLEWDLGGGSCDDPGPTDANMAAGFYSQAASVLTLLPETANSCNQPPTWLDASFTVSDLTGTAMTWTVTGEETQSLTWARRDSGSTGVLGIWATAEADRSYLIELSADGTFYLSWDGACGGGMPPPTCNSGEVLCGDGTCRPESEGCAPVSGCPAPRAVCPAGPYLETCSDLQTDPWNCGSCGNACDPAGQCVDGVCVEY